MPPEIQPVDLPKTMGKDAAEWLAVHGLVDRKPSLRSSDYGMIRRCPFTYYLCRRLGLIKELRYSEALSRGTWVHHRFAMITLPEEEATSMMYGLLDARLKELRQSLKDSQASPDATSDILFREEKDFQVTSAWFEAALTVPCIDNRHNLKDWLLNDDQWQHVGQELLIKHGDCVVQPDLLLYNKLSNKLWVVDFKTCAGSPHLRLQTCPWEFQTQHYFHTIRKQALRDDLLQVLDLPSNTEMGGVMHIAVAKPTIQFGMNDRYYTLDTTPFKSGPRKGQPRNTKKYEGEPCIDIYQDRCMSWYHGLDEYEHLAPERAIDPPVNISFTPRAMLLEQSMDSMYHERLKKLRAYRYAPCQPDQFPVGEVVAQHNKLPTYSSFIMAPVSRWLDVMKDEHFVIRDRDNSELVDGVHASFNHPDTDQ
tara:strand:- start:2964 stop:4229 length:1266 start_codon:yes stop_codon:yes gene_type:complete